MISEYTQRQLTPGRFFTRDLDDIRVKGKLDSVTVFELMRADTVATEESLKNFISTFHEGRKAYKNKEWPQALAIFSNCLVLRPHDKATALYTERCQSYIEEAPGDQWDGVSTFTHK